MHTFYFTIEMGLIGRKRPEYIQTKLHETAKGVMIILINRKYK